MNRREAIAKATTTTTVASAGLLDPTQSVKFLEVLKDSDPFGKLIGQDIVKAPSGEINRLATASRLIRAAAENADDGYRAEPTFPTVPYQTVKVRLPWEVTEDVYHENIEGAGLESKLVRQMTEQFANDLSDLDINGDTAAGAGPDQAFLQIDNGLLKLATGLAAGRRVDGSAINAGDLSKAHFFAGLKALPNKFVSQGGLVWLMSPKRYIDWIETLTDRATGAGDAALLGLGAGGPGSKPLNIEIVPVPQITDDTRIILTNPKNLRRVISWEVRRRKVTGDTDWELATRDKRGYIFFLKRDFLILDTDAIVDVHSLAAV